jgi:hypothetical protein
MALFPVTSRNMCEIEQKLLPESPARNTNAVVFHIRVNLLMLTSGRYF